MTMRLYDASEVNNEQQPARFLAIRARLCVSSISLPAHSSLDPPRIGAPSNWGVRPDGDPWDQCVGKSISSLSDSHSLMMMMMMMMIAGLCLISLIEVVPC